MRKVIQSFIFSNIPDIRIAAFDNFLVNNGSNHSFPGGINKFFQCCFKYQFELIETHFIFSFLDLNEGVKDLAERKEELLLHQESVEIIVERADGVFHDLVDNYHDYLKVFRLEETFDQEYFDNILEVYPLWFPFFDKFIDEFFAKFWFQHKISRKKVDFFILKIF